VTHLHAGGLQATTIRLAARPAEIVDAENLRVRPQLAQRSHLHVEREPLRIGERRFVGRRQQRRGGDEQRHGEVEESPLQPRRAAQSLPEPGHRAILLRRA